MRLPLLPRLAEVQLRLLRVLIQTTRQYISRKSQTGKQTSEENSFVKALSSHVPLAVLPAVQGSPPTPALASEDMDALRFDEGEEEPQT